MIDDTNMFTCMFCMHVGDEGLEIDNEGAGACYDAFTRDTTDESDTSKLGQFSGGFGRLVARATDSVILKDPNAWADNESTFKYKAGAEDEFEAEFISSHDDETMTLVSHNLKDGWSKKNLGFKFQSNAELQCFIAPPSATAYSLTDGVTIDEEWVTTSKFIIDMSHYAAAEHLLASLAGVVAALSLVLF